MTGIDGGRRRRRKEALQKNEENGKWVKKGGPRTELDARLQTTKLDCGSIKKRRRRRRREITELPSLLLWRHMETVTGMELYYKFARFEASSCRDGAASLRNVVSSGLSFR